MNWTEPFDAIDHEYILGGPLTPAHTPTPFLSQPLPVFTAYQHSNTQIVGQNLSPVSAHLAVGPDWSTPPTSQKDFCVGRSNPVLAPNTGNVFRYPSFDQSPNLPTPRQRVVTKFHANGGRILGLGIQTPPPTNPVWTRYPAELDQGNMADQRRMSNSGRTVMGPPETPSRISQASPQLFTNSSLQFSPDLFQPHLLSGPQTAPAYPQQRLFWDSSTPSADVFSTPRPFQNPFALPQDHLTSPFAPSPAILPPNPPSHGQQQPIVPSQSSASSTSTTRPTALDAHFLPPFTTSPRLAPPTADDPSLFLSSPARRFGGPDSNTSFSRPAPEVPAYHHQIEESKREKEFERARKAKARRSSGILASTIEPKRSVSPANSNGRPGLRRSLTHTGADDRRHSYHHSQVSFADTVSVHSNRSGSGTQSRGGRSSPLKSSQDYGSFQAPSRKRTSLTFTIDEDGRARTVVTKVPEDDLMDLDEESTESDSDSTDQPIHSFAFEEQDESPAVSRLRKEWNHSKNSSYSSRQSSHTSSNHSNRTNDGNAKEALRAILHDRAPSNAARRSASLSQSQQFHSSPPVQQQGFNASPTTITDPDISTPSTDRESNGSTRCICSSSSPDGQFMIQCESCSKWLHTHCVGIDSRAIPAVYICVYCAQTPARGGRAPRPINGSPLAHKSFMQQGQGRYR